MALMVVVLLPGCSLFGKSEPKTRLESLQVIAAARANRNSATALDVLFVYDNSALPLLPANGPAWFRQKDGASNTFGRSVDIVSLEVPPVYQLSSVELPGRASRAIRVIAYANYLAQAGQAPIDITAYRHVTLTLQPDGIDRSGS